MTNKKTKILITGANGYIGLNLVKSALEKQLEVGALVRNQSTFPIKHPNLNIFSYDLSTPFLDEHAFDGADAIIHLATTINSPKPNWINIELAAVRNLLEQAKKFGVKKFIFISSQSASPSSPTHYGYKKWLIEEEVRKLNGIILRPGLVYGGDEEKALFGKMCLLAKKLPLLPKFFPNLFVQPLHIEDLTQALLTLSTRDKNNLTTYCISQTEIIDITDFLQTLAWNRFNRFLFTLPLPKFLLIFAAKIINHENVRGLISLKKMDVLESLNDLNLATRNLEDGLRTKRKQLLKEAVALIQYVSGAKNKIVARDYVRLIEKSEFNELIKISIIYLAFPSSIRFIDPKSQIFQFKHKEELDRRLKLAINIAENNPLTSYLFTMFKPVGFFTAIFSMGYSLIWESLFLVFSVTARLFQTKKI